MATAELTISNDSVPLSRDEHGVVRVGGTRVTLDTVLAAFQDGSTAEEIVDHYPSLKLADVYSVIGYYLNHRQEVDEYLQRQRGLAEEARRAIEADGDQREFKERLLARRRQQS